MRKISLGAMAFCILMAGLAQAQESKREEINWARVREAFESYCQSPSADNANMVLAAMPDSFSYQQGDFTEFAAASRYIFNGRLFKVLKKLVHKGDKPALRIALRTLYISSGRDDMVCILIGKSIRVDPILFLEEFKASGLERAWLDLILTGFGWEDEGYPELSDREIRLRLRSLQSVDRPDLIDIRDICIERLKREQEYRRGGDSHGAPSSRQYMGR
jgi:hypothetical protein